MFFKDFEFCKLLKIKKTLTIKNIIVNLNIFVKLNDYFINLKTFDIFVNRNIRLIHQIRLQNLNVFEKSIINLRMKFSNDDLKFFVFFQNIRCKFKFDWCIFWSRWTISSTNSISNKINIKEKDFADFLKQKKWFEHRNNWFRFANHERQTKFYNDEHVKKLLQIFVACDRCIKNLYSYNIMIFLNKIK